MLNYKNIVVGTDFSKGSNSGVAAAIRVANRFGAQRVHLIHVVNAAPMLPGPLLQDAAGHGEAAQAAVEVPGADEVEGSLGHAPGEQTGARSARCRRELRWGRGLGLGWNGEGSRS